MTILKLAALIAVTEALVAAVGDNLNTYLNLFTIALVVLAAVPVARARRKDQTIKDLEEALKAKTALADERADTMRQLEQGCQHLKTEATEWRARYEEQAKYTAEAAVAHFEESLEGHREQVAERHRQMIASLASIAETLERLESSP
jgi:membrane protein implicated in regulation of membrane protease activity